MGWLADPTTRLCRSLSTPSPINTHYYCGHTSPRKLQLLLTLTSALSGTPPTENSSWCYQHKQTFKAEGKKVPTINHCSAHTFWPSRWMKSVWSKEYLRFPALRMCLCVCMYVWEREKEGERKKEREGEGEEITYNKTMKVGLISGIHIHRMYFFSQAGRKDRSGTGYCISSLHTNTTARAGAHQMCLCAEREKSDGEVDQGGRWGDVESLFQHSNPRLRVCWRSRRLK